MVGCVMDSECRVVDTPTDTSAGNQLGDSSAAVGGYAGRLKIIKAPSMGALRSASGKVGWMGADLAFKWGRRKGFTLERFSLPPEGGMGARRTRGEGDDPFAF
jgi:hypothetical protein